MVVRGMPLMLSDKGSLLVDVGLTGKKMEDLFSQIDRNIKDLNGILVTHEHSDHIKGLGVLKYGLPIYANENTWKAIEIVKFQWIKIHI